MFLGPKTNKKLLCYNGDVRTSSFLEMSAYAPSLYAFALYSLCTISPWHLSSNKQGCHENYQMEGIH